MNVREWIIEAIKMYYIEILTHGLVFMIGAGVGMAITDLVGKESGDEWKSVVKRRDRLHAEKPASVSEEVIRDV